MPVVVSQEVRARRVGVRTSATLPALFALALSGVFSVLFLRHVLAVLLSAGALSPVAHAGTVIVALGTLALLYGNLVFLIARYSAFIRLRRHRPDAEEAIRSCHRGPAPTLAVLVPSYKESAAVVRRTLLSAALQDYPHKQVILLIDDPPQPADAESAVLLAAMRGLPRQVQGMLAGISAELGHELRAWERRRATAETGPELLQLGRLHRRAASWLEALAADHPADNHEEHFFVEAILREPARQHRDRAAFLEGLAAGAGADLAFHDQEYRRLAGLFHADLSAFERKQFVNLSHEPNKAMNLNSYLSVMGGVFTEKRGVGGWYLVPAGTGQAGRAFATADFVITLDADSVIARDYAARLVHFMGAPGNERVAVAQTPYSAYPHARKPLERIAGATTDIQYFVHQGFTAHGATYWVGANALLRKAALDDIAATGTERGHQIRRFIHDRTVIEDTESSVDLLLHGWSLHNYPERLAHSSTPPDFGSLIIQRRRWANGGLLILPKLLRYLGRRSPVPQRMSHGFMGIHYLVSPAAASAAVLLLLFVPMEQLVASPWLPLAALPYFLAYGADLVRAGYRFSDIVGVYALNMLLVPVNLAGVGRSLIQAATGRKSPFGRTPKIDDHTATPPFYVAAIAILFATCIGIAVADVLAGRPLHAVFAALNAALLGFGFLRFIGLRQTITDLAKGLREHRGRTSAVLRPASDAPPSDEPAKVTAERL